MKGLTWHHLLLLAVLAIVGYYGYLTFSNRYQAKSWDEPLTITIYPLNDGGDPEIQAFIDRVSPEQFQPAADFLQMQAIRYGIKTTPLIKLQMADAANNDAPPPPPAIGTNMLTNLMWSLELRYWAYKNAANNNNKTTISVFVMYKRYLPGDMPIDSISLRNGMLAVVHAFANPERQGLNNVVFAHELMHTVGATDKYNDKLQPVFPDGFAFPNNNPPYPQEFCELMAIYIPITPERADLPHDLSQCVIGIETAHEINWW